MLESRNSYGYNVNCIHEDGYDWIITTKDRCLYGGRCFATYKQALDHAKNFIKNSKHFGNDIFMIEIVEYNYKNYCGY